MKINSHNDWDPLEEIVVGHAHHARISIDRSSHSFSYANQKLSAIEHLEGPYPVNLIDEANQDIDNFAQVLRDLNVIVHRPAIQNHDLEFSTPNWKSRGNHNWCPRDLILPLGNMLIETSVAVRSRYFETDAYRNILYEAFEDNALWIAAPRPKLLDNMFDIENDVRGRSTLMDREIVFDAANVVRVGRDLLYQISNSGNIKGFRWLKRLLEPLGYRLHYSELYSYAHFDSTIIPLRPGLVLLNSSRVTPENCPTIFAKWDKIWFEDCVANPCVLKNWVAPCSPYIGMNILSIDTDTVIVEENQLPLIHMLEKYHIKCIAVRFRHAQTLSGGFHCCTLDLRRRGQLEDYC